MWNELIVDVPSINLNTIDNKLYNLPSNTLKNCRSRNNDLLNMRFSFRIIIIIDVDHNYNSQVSKNI